MEHNILNVLMVISDLLMDHHYLKELCYCVLIMHGEQFVGVVDGAILRHKLSVIVWVLHLMEQQIILAQETCPILFLPGSLAVQTLKTLF